MKVDLCGKYGEVIPADEYFQPLAGELLDATFAQFDDRDKELGVYDLTGEVTREFTEGELVIDGNDIESIECKVELKVRVFRPRIRSYFDVERRGRFHRSLRTSTSTVVRLQSDLSPRTLGNPKGA